MFRKNLKISTIVALGVFAGGLLTSCSLDNEPTINGNNGMLVKAPDMTAYTGDHYWKTTNGTRTADKNGNEWGNTWDCVDNVYPRLTDDDLAEIKRLLSPGHPVENNIIIPFENYWVQQVFKGDSKYHAVDKSGNETNEEVWGSNHMDKLLARNEHQDWVYNESNNWQGGYAKVEYDHISDFNNGDNQTVHGTCTCGRQHVGTTLMKDMSKDGITPNNQFGYHETWGHNDRNNYIIIEYKGNYYVGFDYQADTDRQNPGEPSRVERDWNFTDWIVRITPAYHLGTTPENPGTTPETPETPDTPDHQEKCKQCPHEAHPGEYCEECDEDAFCQHFVGDQPILFPGPGDPGFDSGFNGPDDPENPGTPGAGPTIKKGIDDVEVNLALDKKKDDLLESHLSMHVRYATDVEVFIPVPATYYCAADDMAIVLQHSAAFVHGGPYKTVYEIGDNKVSLNVSFEEGGIKIWTEGITQEVIDYCWDNFKDGITFEVWNYFNDPETSLPYITMEELKEYLDKATIKFTDVPKGYVNAFGRDNGKYEESNPDGKDFHVKPEEQKESFNDPVDGPYLNGSDNNEIYKRT